MKFLKVLLEIAGLMILGISLDVVWIAYLSGDLYLSEIGHLLRLNSEGTLDAQIWPAIFVYLAFSVGIIVFVKKAYHGALLGSIIYCVYDMTNVSLLKGWGIKLAIIDICWGTFLLFSLSWFYLLYQSKFKLLYPSYPLDQN